MGTTPEEVTAALVAVTRNRLEHCLDRIVHCVNQLDDQQVWWRPSASMNSIANLILHLCGNLRQWIVSGISGTPDVRDRPMEFAERQLIPRDDLLKRMREAVGEADAVTARLSAEQLLQPRRIQGFDETVLSALFDSVTHLCGHVQEIVHLTRQQLGDAYRFAWVPATPEQGAPVNQ